MLRASGSARDHRARGRWHPVCSVPWTRRNPSHEQARGCTDGGLGRGAGDFLEDRRGHGGGPGGSRPRGGAGLRRSRAGADPARGGARRGGARPARPHGRGRQGAGPAGVDGRALHGLGAAGVRAGDEQAHGQEALPAAQPAHAPRLPGGSRGGVPGPGTARGPGLSLRGEARVWGLVGGARRGARARRARARGGARVPLRGRGPGGGHGARPGGGGVGGPGGLGPAVERACRFGGEALVERMARGREVTVGILGDEVLGSCEIATPREGFDFDAKYKGGSRYFVPARLSPTRLGNVEALALAAYRALGCRGYGRVDLICSEEDNDVVLEVNTLPGMTPTSLLPKIAAARGLDFPSLMERILALATRDEGEGVEELARPLEEVRRAVG